MAKEGTGKRKKGLPQRCVTRRAAWAAKYPQHKAKRLAAIERHIKRQPQDKAAVKDLARLAVDLPGTCPR